MNKLGTKLGAIAMSATMALTFAPSTLFTLAAGTDAEHPTGLYEPVYRFYNAASGEHLFTTSEAEGIDLAIAGWTDEGVAWSAPYVGEPVYRLYNPNVFDAAGNPLGDHVYTTSEEEATMLQVAGWSLDESSFYSALATDSSAVGITRLYNPNAYTTAPYSGAHTFTADALEIAFLENQGWSNEGFKIFGYAEQPPVEEFTVTIDNTTPKVGDTLTAEVTGGEGTVTYQWLANDLPIPGATNETLVVSSDQLGKVISVVVTDEEGNTAESEDTAAVTHKDLSVEVTIEDLDGLQEDGTALPGDTLHLSYGAALGTPESIIWYKDGAALKVNTARGGFGGAFDTVPRGVAGTASKARGEWYVVVENTAGENFVSNSIMVTPADAAVMSGVTITEDYEGPHIEYTKTTSTAVVTVTLNKDYDGTFYLAPEAKTTFYNKTDLKNQIQVATTTLGTITDVPKLKDLTDKTAAGLAAGKGLKYLNDETGEVTYKFPIKMAAAGDPVTRGKDYNLIFDQDDIDEDDLPADSGKGKLEDLDLNMTEALTVPYVAAPDSIAITNYATATGAGATIKIGLYDESGEALAWYDQTTGQTKMQGFSSNKVFNTDNNSIKTTDSPCTGPSDVIAEDGVVTLEYTAQTKQYAYVKLSTTAGVFASGSIDYTTDVVETVAPAMTGMTLKEADTPEDAKIEFTNLTKRASGTVYLFQSNKTVNGTTNTDIVAQNKEGAWMLASTTVEGGISSVTLEGVFDKAVIGATGVDQFQDYYAAVFVPDEPEYYAETVTATFQLTQKIKSYKLAAPIEDQAAGTFTHAIIGVDQFGDDIDLSVATSAALVTAGEAKALDNTVDTAAGAGTVQAAIDNEGTITLTATGASAGDFVKGTSHSFTIAGGQKLTVKCSDTTDGKAANSKFTITLS